MPDAALLKHQSAISRAAVARVYAAMPELADRYGERGREKCVEDTERTVEHLAEAVWLGEPAVFVEYLRWAVGVMIAHGVEASHFQASLRHLRDTIPEFLSAERAAIAGEFLQAAVGAVGGEPECAACEIRENAHLAGLAGDYLKALLGDDRLKSEWLITNAIAGGTTLRELYLDVFVPVQREVGRLWQTSAISVAREHLCTQAVTTMMRRLALDVLYVDRPRNGRHIVCAGVSGELHEVGIRMVADLFEAEGWIVHYYGAQTPASSIAAEVARLRPEVVALSATMAVHLRRVSEAIAAIRALPFVGREVRIVVGGRAFSCNPQGIAAKIGADAYAPDAVSALVAAERSVQAA